MFGETMNPEAFAAILASSIHDVSIEKYCRQPMPTVRIAIPSPIGCFKPCMKLVATSLEALPEPVQLTR